LNDLDGGDGYVTVQPSQVEPVEVMGLFQLELRARMAQLNTTGSSLAGSRDDGSMPSDSEPKASSTTGS